MKCEIYQMIPDRIQLTEIVVQSVTDHHKGAVMDKNPGEGTEHSMIGKEI